MLQREKVQSYMETLRKQAKVETFLPQEPPAAPASESAPAAAPAPAPETEAAPPAEQPAPAETQPATEAQTPEAAKEKK
jgi:hypothetical protein